MTITDKEFFSLKPGDELVISDEKESISVRRTGFNEQGLSAISVERHSREEIIVWNGCPTNPRTMRPVSWLRNAGVKKVREVFIDCILRKAGLFNEIILLFLLLYFIIV